MSEPAATLPAEEPRHPPARWLGRPAFWIAAVLLLGAVPLARAWLVPPPPPLPVLGTLPDFNLTDQTGAPSGLTALRGKVWVADFVFTRCPSICPLLTERMGQIERRSEGLGPDLQLVSFSVDPEFDSPAVLTRYMRNHKINPARWRFLTGSTASIESVITEGFKEVLERDKKKGPEDFLSIVHGGHFVLVDRRGQIRGYYDSNEATAVDAVLRDAGQLVNRGD